MRNPYDYTLGQIECIILSEREDATVLLACQTLHRFLVDREKEMQGYQVKKEIAMVRSKPAVEGNRRVRRSEDNAEFDSCVLVTE